jgi:hypothetical protein
MLVSCMICYATLQTEISESISLCEGSRCEYQNTNPALRCSGQLQLLSEGDKLWGRRRSSANLEKLKTILALSLN